MCGTSRHTWNLESAKVHNGMQATVLTIVWNKQTHVKPWECQGSQWHAGNCLNNCVQQADTRESPRVPMSTPGSIMCGSVELCHFGKIFYFRHFLRFCFRQWTIEINVFKYQYKILKYFLLCFFYDAARLSNAQYVENSRWLKTQIMQMFDIK